MPLLNCPKKKCLYFYMVGRLRSFFPKLNLRKPRRFLQFLSALNVPYIADDSLNN